MSYLLQTRAANGILFSEGLVNKKRFTWFARMIGAVIIMNALDGILTLIWVCSDRAVEANPLMAILLDIHPVLFMSSKIVLVQLGAILLMRYCNKSLAVLSLILAFSAYWGVLMYHSSMAFI